MIGEIFSEVAENIESKKGEFLIDRVVFTQKSQRFLHYPYNRRSK